MYDIIIVGSGPAGLSAAVYAKRAGMELMVLERNPMSGGQVLNTYEVDNYLGLPGMNGFDMGMAFRQHADKLGVRFEEDEVTDILQIEGGFKVVAAQKEYEAKTVIVASGAHHAHLDVPGEEKLAGMGVSYCATCDGAFFRGRSVAVVGGGDVALEDAIYLARTCEKVYLIHRRDEFRGARILQEELLALPNVEVCYSMAVEEICGEDMVEAIRLKNLKTGEKSELAVNGVFVAVGIHPDTELLDGLVRMDEAGYVLANEYGETNVNGLFVAGDIRKKNLRQIVTAVADGANAAVSAADYIRKH